MNRLVRWFLQGLIYFVPIALTVFVLVASFRAIDRGLGGLLGTTVPGVGVLILVVGVTLLGFLLSNFLSRRILGLFERFLDRLPLVKLLHTSVKDLMGAFVGEHRRFDQPVAVEIETEIARSAEPPLEVLWRGGAGPDVPEPDPARALRVTAFVKIP